MLLSVQFKTGPLVGAGRNRLSQFLSFTSSFCLSPLPFLNNNLSAYKSNSVQYIPGRTYDGYTDLLSYIVHLKQDKNIVSGRFDAYNLFSLPDQNWDYIIDFAFDAGGSIVVKAYGMFHYTEHIVYASKQSNGTYAWTGGWKTLTYA